VYTSEESQAQSAGRTRRRHSAQFKEQVVRACRQPGVSTAAVALAHGLNANMLRRWIVESATAPAAALAAPVAPAASQSQFIALQPPPREAGGSDIRIEVKRGALAICVTWPAQQASACAALLGEILR